MYVKTIITDAILMKLAVFFSALILSVSSLAATNNLDQLMQDIRADIQAQRLGNPPGNNALEKINAFRAQAPFDFRIVPLVYEWGEAYVALADKALTDGDAARAQSFLDRVWPVAALTPGLESLQARVDSAAATAPATVARTPAGPTPEERARQQRAVAEAAQERARLDAERQKRLAEARQQAEQEQKAADAQRRRQQEEERLRRIAQQEAEAQRQAEAARVVQQASRQAAAPVVAVVSAPEPTTAIDWDDVRETSKPTATYPVSYVKLNNRDRALTDDMVDVCRAIVDEDASVVIHTPDTADYRWLTVRLTLCLRRLDSSFRLRHSHQASSGGEAFLTLHPTRSVSLLRQIDN